MSLVSGSAAAQGVALLSSLMVARLFLPEVFGSFAVVSSLVVTIGVVSTLRLEAAVPIPGRDFEAASLVRVCLTIAAVVSLVMAAAVALFGGSIAVSLGLKSDAVVALRLAPVSVLLVGVFNVLNQLALRQRKYLTVASRTMVQAVTTAVFQVFGGFWWPTPTMLMIGLVAGQLLGVLVLARGSREWVPAPFGLTRRRLKEYKRFPLVLAPTALVNTLGLQAPLLLGIALYGANFSGWFGMTQRFLALPVTVLGTSIGQLCLGEFSRMIRSRDAALGKAFFKASLYLAVVGILVGSLVAAFGPSVFRIALGEAYHVSGEYARALAVGLAFQMAAAPLSSLLILRERQIWLAMWDVSRLLVTVTVMVFAWRIGFNAVEALSFVGLAQAFSYFVLWVLTVREVRSYSAALPACASIERDA